MVVDNLRTNSFNECSCARRNTNNFTVCYLSKIKCKIKNFNFGLWNGFSHFFWWFHKVQNRSLTLVSLLGFGWFRTGFAFLVVSYISSKYKTLVKSAKPRFRKPWFRKGFPRNHCVFRSKKMVSLKIVAKPARILNTWNLKKCLK